MLQNKNNYRPVKRLKIYFNEDWKEFAKTIYNVDENISEEDLREMLLSEIPEEFKSYCGIILDNKREAFLYEKSLETVNKTLKYDCGSGEKTYDARNFNPKNENEMIDKDIIDCSNLGETYSEKRCFKQGNKLLSDKVQCCWCDYSEKDLTSQRCLGARINEMKEYFTDYKKAYLAFKPDANFRFNCRCVNKKNEMMNVNFDSVSDEMIIN